MQNVCRGRSGVGSRDCEGLEGLEEEEDSEEEGLRSSMAGLVSFLISSADSDSIPIHVAGARDLERIRHVLQVCMNVQSRCTPPI